MTKQTYCILHECCVMTNHNYHIMAPTSMVEKVGILDMTL